MDVYGGSLTPFGFLQNPDNVFPQDPKGVVKVLDYFQVGWLIGFGWFLFEDQVDKVMSFGLAFEVKGRLLRSQRDFVKEGIEVKSTYHSKNIINHVFNCEGLSAEAEYTVLNGDALGCLLRLRSKEETKVTVFPYIEFKGAGGPLSLYNSDVGRLYYLALKGGRETLLLAVEGMLNQCRMIGSKEDIPAAKGGGSIAYGVKELKVRGGVLELRLAAIKGGDMKSLIEKGSAAISKLRSTISAKRKEDESFWRRAPLLTGDWPTHWLNGFIYDVETLRHMVYPPKGVLRHRWDIMHVNWPRVVLAETSIDMLMLSYFDIEMAKEVIHGVFEDSPLPNVPCIHADGSFNMVAYDGSPCGTSPVWCLPFYCYEIIYSRSGDMGWVKDTYWRWRSYLKWWMENRRDEDGFFHYKCSWESGEDNATRFGILGKGSESIEHIKVPELAAAMAHAAKLMAYFSSKLGLEEEVKEWRETYLDCVKVLERHWHRGWYHDYDADKGGYTRFKDALHLTPLLLGVSERRKELSRRLEDVNSLLREMSASVGWDVLWWPCFVFPLFESLSLAEDREGVLRGYLRELAYRVVERAYKYSDLKVRRGYASPGTSYEHWGHLEDGYKGVECYGWGALPVLIIFRYILGVREGGPEECSLTVNPNIPQPLLRSGAKLGVSGYRYRDLRLSLLYSIKEGGLLEVKIKVDSSKEGLLTAETPSGAEKVRLRKGEVMKLKLCNGEVVKLSYKLKG